MNIKKIKLICMAVTLSVAVSLNKRIHSGFKHNMFVNALTFTSINYYEL